MALQNMFYLASHNHWPDWKAALFLGITTELLLEVKARRRASRPTGLPRHCNAKALGFSAIFLQSAQLQRRQAYKVGCVNQNSTPHPTRFLQ